MKKSTSCDGKSNNESNVSCRAKRAREKCDKVGSFSLYADKDNFIPSIIHGNTPKNINIQNTFRQSQRNKDLLLKDILNKVCSINDTKIRKTSLSKNLGSNSEEKENNFNETFTLKENTNSNNFLPSENNSDSRIEKDKEYVNNFNEISPLTKEIISNNFDDIETNHKTKGRKKLKNIIFCNNK